MNGWVKNKNGAWILKGTEGKCIAINATPSEGLKAYHKDSVIQVNLDDDTIYIKVQKVKDEIQV